MALRMCGLRVSPIGPVRRNASDEQAARQPNGRLLARLRRFDRLLAVKKGFFSEKALINQRQHLQKRLRCRPTPLQAL